MNASTLLFDLQARGFTLEANGDKLTLSPSSALDTPTREAVRAHKAALLQLLTTDSYQAVPGLRAPAPRDPDRAPYNFGAPLEPPKAVVLLAYWPLVERAYQGEGIGPKRCAAILRCVSEIEAATKCDQDEVVATRLEVLSEIAARLSFVPVPVDAGALYSPEVATEFLYEDELLTEDERANLLRYQQRAVSLSKDEDEGKPHT